MSRNVRYLNTSFMSDTVTREERLAAIGAQRSEADQIEFLASWLLVGAVMTFLAVVWAL